MAEVSRNLVAILLVLVIVVSAAGTWSLFASRENTVSTVQYPGLPSDASGFVSLQIEETSHAGVALEVAEVPQG